MTLASRAVCLLMRLYPVRRTAIATWRFFWRLRAGTMGMWVAVVRDRQGRLLAINDPGDRPRLARGSIDVEKPVPSQVCEYLRGEPPGIRNAVPELVAIEGRGGTKFVFVFLVQTGDGASRSVAGWSWLDPRRVVGALDVEDQRLVSLCMPD